VIVPTASAPFKVKIDKTADGVTVTDYQGNVAKVMSADLGSGNARVHAIDKVLFSGEFDSLCDVACLTESEHVAFVQGCCLLQGRVAVFMHALQFCYCHAACMCPSAGPLSPARQSCCMHA
jgi:hypothetical protein